MKTFAEKILGAKAGTIVYKEPNIVLTHDNTASIHATFKQMNADRPANPNQLLVVLDHNAPPTTPKLANQYLLIRKLVKQYGIEKFYDAGRGICHQIMSYHAQPGQIIVGSDSHTCTAGAFNAFAAGIDRTEAAGLWKNGETWFRVPESIKIVLTGKLQEGVFAKDLSLYIIGSIFSDGANYQSIEFHGNGVENLSISDRMTLANLASEMGAKNAVFPPDATLAKFYGKKNIEGIWADNGANYAKELTINLSTIPPLVAAPHQVDNIKTVTELAGTKIQQGVIGTCTNGRIEDLREASQILNGKKIADDFQLLVIPASQEIYLQALQEGIIDIFVRAGANVLTSSCGPCLGTGQGIPADECNVLSTANRNFLGRMGNKKAFVYLASPVSVARAAINGEITASQEYSFTKFESKKISKSNVSISEGEKRCVNKVWNYSDIDDINTDLMFAGHRTYSTLSSDAASILPYLLEDFDANFASSVQEGDIILAGDNFGCGSSREHPAVGLSYAGIKTVIVKSVNRIFFRSAINQGLMVIVCPRAVESYQNGEEIKVDTKTGELWVANRKYELQALPEKLSAVIEAGGLVASEVM